MSPLPVSNVTSPSRPLFLAIVTWMSPAPVAASTHPEGIAYPALDEQSVRLVFCLLGDANTTADHLAGLARLARLARRRNAIEPLIEATDGREFIAALEKLEGG